MKLLQIGFAIICIFAKSVYANEQSTCRFLPKSEQPSWVNSAGRDDEYYYAVGGASGKQGESYFDINQFINNARQDAINNLASSIRSGVKTSTKRTIESKKEGKSKAEIRKEVNQKVEVVSQVALSAVTDDARWLDQKNCLLWYRVKVSKAGAEFAVKAYVNQVAEKLHKKIEQLTKREIEQILSDNGFAATLPHATQSLLNNNTAYYRGQSYNIAELYNQSGFDWLNSITDYFYSRNSHAFLNILSITPYYYSKNNIPTAIIKSNSPLNKKINALRKLQSFGVDLNDVRVGLGQQHLGGKYISLRLSDWSYRYVEQNGIIYREKLNQKYTKEIKSPFVYNFDDVNGDEKLGLLHFAISSHQKGLIEPLINLGVDINQQSKHGYSPLAFAIQAGQFSIAQQLLSLGAEPSINNYLAFKIAYLFQHIEQNLISSSITRQHPSTINFASLADTIGQMKLPNKTANQIRRKIKTQFSSELKVISMQKSTQGHYNEHDKSITVKQTFINGVKM